MDDQIGGPTSAKKIACACLNITNQLLNDPEKVVFIISVERRTLAGVVLQILSSKKQEDLVLQLILTTDYKTKAKRPQNSRLDCSLKNVLKLIGRYGTMKCKNFN